MPAHPHDLDLATLLADDSKWAAGLRCLLEAHYWAQPHRDRWAYAVPVSQLRKHGLTNPDLHLLLSGSYVRLKSQGTPAKRGGGKSGCPGKSPLYRSASMLLTPRGMLLARKVYLLFAKDNRSNGSGHHWDHELAESRIPHWDAERGQFWVGNVLVMRISRRAKNLRAFLDGFEEIGWEPHLDDPLPGEPGLDRKARLHDALVALNCKQKPHLVQFHADGTGQGTWWEYCEANFEQIFAQTED